MSLKKNFSYNILIQAIGPFLSFLTIFLLARLVGPIQQGLYAKIYAWINFIVVLGVFGFPQSFIYVINKHNVHRGLLLKAATMYTLIFGTILGSILIISYRYSLLDSQIISSLFGLFFVVVTIVILVYHGLFRGVYLTYNQNIGFAIVSILPAVSLFFFMIFFLIYRVYIYQLVFFISSLLLLLILLFLKRNIDDGIKLYPFDVNKLKSELPLKILFNHGTNSFIQALLLSLQPVVAYWFISKYIGGNDYIGYFNIGLFLQQGFLVPISMVVPILFEYWTRNNNFEIVKKITNFKIFILELLIGVLLASFIPFLVSCLFGSKYDESVVLSQILLFLIPITFHSRLLNPAIHSMGFPLVNSIGAIVRFFLFIITTFSFVFFSELNLNTLALCWTVSELIIAIYFYYKFKSKLENAAV